MKDRAFVHACHARVLNEDHVVLETSDPARETLFNCQQGRSGIKNKLSA